VTAITAPSERRNHERRVPHQQDSLFTEASMILSAVGIDRSASWLTRTIHDFRRSAIEGMPFGVYLVARVGLNEQQRRAIAERADLRYILSYADPTGETAVRNLMRRGGVSGEGAGPHAR